MAGCSDGNKQIIEEMSLKIDSLEKINTNRLNDLTNLTTFIETLSDGLDSIAQQENMLFYTNKGKERTIVDRKQLRKNLEMFAETVQNQRLRITQLTEDMKKRGANIDKLNKLIAYLNHQLDEKDKSISKLRLELNKKNVNIVQLNDRISTLAESNYNLTNEVENQKQELSKKDDIINRAYIKVGSKKELKDGGILSSGFLKKTKVNYQNLPKDKFEEVDIRLFKEIKISSNKPKVLSPMPESSYELIKNGNGITIMRVIDPVAFWRVSNFLIIQTN